MENGEAAKQLGCALFTPNNYRAERSAAEYVTQLYAVCLRQEPDKGYADWVAQAGGSSGGRGPVLEAFLGMGAFTEQADALYREIYWLVSDQLGTTRMIAERTGSLAGLKRHDYLPFGEEIAAHIGARNVTHNAYGYVDDSNRMQFTGHERDEETGLDYMQARHYGSALGRFVSVDTVGGNKADPQTLNLYAYVNNNPLRYTDPTGHSLADIGVLQTDNEYVARETERRVTAGWTRAMELGRFMSLLDKKLGKSSGGPDVTVLAEETGPAQDDTQSGGEVTASAEITGVAEPQDDKATGVEKAPSAKKAADAMGQEGPFILSEEELKKYGTPENPINQPCVGSGDCVALPQTLLNLRNTAYWTPGDTVLGNNGIKPGTVIATFYEGVYPSAASGSREYHRVGGNHAAIFLRQGTLNGTKGIYVIDQWSSRGHAGIRFIYADTGQITDRSNDARAFSVVLTYPLRTRRR